MRWSLLRAHAVGFAVGAMAFGVGDARALTSTSMMGKTTSPTSTTTTTATPTPPSTAARRLSTPVAQKRATRPARGTKPTHPRGDPAARRIVAAGPTIDDVILGAETPELRALHDAERELFPPAVPAFGTPWPSELGSPLASSEDIPRVHASGLPPAPPPSSAPTAEGGKDLSWLARLDLPDLPVRWDARVVRYLEFFKDDPRGHALFSYWLRRSGRYRDAIRRTLRRKALPEDLVWLSMIESGFDPSARSPAGAIGLWQFMPQTAALYGLSQDRWADQRLNVQAATEAAAEFLADLYRRFGSWDLAIASYNMGYAGVMSIVHKYNTNDYWALARLEGALPWETTLYVPKLLAAGIVGRNLSAFGFADVAADPSIETEEINVPAGTALATVAAAAGCTTKEIEALNLELRASRTPPMTPDVAESATYPVKVPVGKGAVASQNLARGHREQAPVERYVVKFGESLDQIAAAKKLPLAKLVELNAIAQGEVVRGGTVLLVPKAPASSGAPAQPPPVTVDTPGPSQATAKSATVIVPSDIFVYPDRRRVFYRVVVGDTMREVAGTFHVSVDDLRRWNDLDPAARLQEGMTLQLFVPSDVDLSRVIVVGENDARVVTVGSDEFFAFWEGVKGKRRITVTAKAGETLEQIGKAHGVTASMMEKVNHRNRGELLREGDTIVVYLPAPTSTANGTVRSEAKYSDVHEDGRSPPAVTATTTSTSTATPTATPNGPLPPAPVADALPPLP